MITFNFKHPIHSDYSNELKNFYNIFSKYVKSNDWAIDIGAGVGDTTLVLGELVGEGGKVICLEPSITYDLLIKNIQINKDFIKRIQPYKIGAYNRYCIKKIVTSPQRDNGGIVDDLFSSEGRNNRSNGYDIDVVNMNNFLFERYSEEERSRIKFIKIDTEGLDFLILNNLRPFINKYKPIIFIEWWNNELLSDVIFDIINQINYNSIRDDNFQKTGPEEFPQRAQNLILIPQ